MYVGNCVSLSASCNRLLVNLKTRFSQNFSMNCINSRYMYCISQRDGRTHHIAGKECKVINELSLIYQKLMKWASDFLKTKSLLQTSQNALLLFQHGAFSKEEGQKTPGLRARSCGNNLSGIMLVKLLPYSPATWKCRASGTKKSPPTTWNVLVCRDKPYFLEQKQW